MQFRYFLMTVAHNWTPGVSAGALGCCGVLGGGVVGQCSAVWSLDSYFNFNFSKKK